MKMETCSVGAPITHVDVAGHRWKKNFKFVVGGGLKWEDDEWFCEYCHKKFVATVEELQGMQS